MNVQEYYEYAKTLIPGGTQLLSKRPELQAPGLWPAYFSKAEGCTITDRDGKQYRDFAHMGVGSCLLGFNAPGVNQAVIQRIQNGSMSSLNPPEEVELAEVLLQIHPWAEKARFARTGGEILAAAIRIARARTRRSMIAVCGYHGWHDWYLAANLSSGTALNEHLLPGLSPLGVPDELGGTCRTFRFNDFEAFNNLIAQHGDKLAAIMMEPMRFDPPKPGFLESIRETADKHGIVLIFDEVTSGWRYRLGGVHPEFGVNPDMAVFAKAMSNGYPMAAVIGTAETMDVVEESFISSTYWTESIGPTAALATIAEFKRIQPWERLKQTGQKVVESWENASANHELPIDCHSTDALSHFSFKDCEANVAKTLFTQCMLERDFLATTAFYATIAHKDTDIDDYAKACDESFHYIKEALSKGNLRDALKGPEAHTGFSRLN